MTPEEYRRMMAGPSNTKTTGLLMPGNILNLYNRPVMERMSPDPEVGSRLDPKVFSTIRTMSFALDNGQEVLVPTVVEGQQMTDPEAMARFYRTGEHLGIFDSPANADAYAKALHNSQVAMGNFYGPTSTLKQMAKVLGKNR